MCISSCNRNPACSIYDLCRRKHNIHRGFDWCNFLPVAGKYQWRKHMDKRNQRRRLLDGNNSNADDHWSYRSNVYLQVQAGNYQRLRINQLFRSGAHRKPIADNIIHSTGQPLRNRNSSARRHCICRNIVLVHSSYWRNKHRNGNVLYYAIDLCYNDLLCRRNKQWMFFCKNSSSSYRKQQRRNHFQSVEYYDLCRIKRYADCYRRIELHMVRCRTNRILDHCDTDNNDNVYRNRSYFLCNDSKCYHHGEPDAEHSACGFL